MTVGKSGIAARRTGKRDSLAIVDCRFQIDDFKKRTAPIIIGNLQSQFALLSSAVERLLERADGVVEVVEAGVDLEGVCGRRRSAARGLPSFR